ncbi:MAG: DUF6531 domain-containing protein, partial [Roseburia sp.]|nr:DUF6531 domain-containing protein [Roseburia sp.]
MDNNKQSFHEGLDEFTQSQIKVECPYPIQTVNELEITKKLNDHGQVLVKGILWEEKGAGCIQQTGSSDPILVYGKNERGKTLLFSGVVTSVDVDFQDGIYYVEIRGQSWTSLLDYEEKRRSFQNKKITYSSLIQQVLGDYPGGTFINCTKPSNKKTGQFLLQYRETDWEFLKRLATHFGTVLTADVTGKAPRFWFGLPKNKIKINHVDRAETWKAAEQYYIQAKDRLELGDLAEYNGHSVIIEESHAFLEKGVLYYTYILTLESSLWMPKKENSRIQGISLLGEVLESKNQQVKMKLKIDKSQDADTACWFPYASQANNLFYCMPETGTSISLYFSSSDETGGIAMNAVRKNGGSCAKTSDPSQKYMGTPEGKEMKLGVTDISFDAAEELFLKMDAGTGVTVQSHEDINIFTKQKLALEAQQMIKIFAKTGDIIVGAKQESCLYIMGGADGDAHIKAGKKLIYNGRKKEVFADRLNEEIAYEEKKIDWGKLATNVLFGLAVVAVVAAAIVFTGGAASVAIGAAISGTIAVGAMAVSDIVRGEVSDLQYYAMAGLKGAIQGAVEGAILGIKALEGLKLIGKMLVGGATGFLSDAIGQGLEFLCFGKPYDWSQGLFSFGLGFITPAASAVLRKGLRKLMEKFGNGMPKWLEKEFCKLGGDPVDLVSGNVIYDTIDFELPGPLPLQWRRIWCSASQVMGHLGHGARYNYEMGLEILEEESALAVFLNDGRVCIFPEIMVGEEFFGPDCKMLLVRHNDHYRLFDPESGCTYFLYESPGGYLPYKLTRIQNRQGHRIEFFYDNNGYLCGITDSADRTLEVTTNKQGRIIQVSLREEESAGKPHVLIGYGYNMEQDLKTVTDAVGADLCMDYKNHLLVKKTDRNGHSFQWEYDKYEDGARAVRTWGEEGVLSLWIDYHDEEGYNTVRTGQSNMPSEYHYDERMLCTRIVYPDSTETREEYDEHWQLASQVDEEGRMTLYQYNDWSQITAVIFADGSKLCFSYDGEGRLVQMIDGEGGIRKWVYNADATLGKVVDEEGAELSYEYNPHKLVEKIVYADKGEVHIEYDRDFNIRKTTLPNGSFSAWEYDRRGNCLSAQNPLGAVEKYRYDRLNRMIGATLADGNEIELSYDGYDGVLHAKDKKTEVDYTYTILGSMASRTQDGHRSVYQYDTEEQLVSITNEKGEVYRFEWDAKGNVIKEVGYDNLTRTYERDYSGLITRINRPGGRFTKYQYDKLGQVTRVDYHDGSYEVFAYNKNGDLVRAENQDVKIRFERDKVGRTTKEWQDNHWVSVKYDEMGNRIQTKSCFGADIAARRGVMG